MCTGFFDLLIRILSANRGPPLLVLFHMSQRKPRDREFHPRNAHLLLGRVIQMIYSTVKFIIIYFLLSLLTTSVCRPVWSGKSLTVIR